jgi:hypothetical protein
VGQEVSFAPLLVIAATRDHVQRHATIADLVERRDGLGREGGDRQVGPVGEQQLQPIGVARDVRRGLRRIRAARPVRREHPVPSRLLVGAGQPQGVVTVEARPATGAGFGPIVGRPDAEELNGHRRATNLDSCSQLYHVVRASEHCEGTGDGAAARPANS